MNYNNKIAIAPLSDNDRLELIVRNIDQLALSFYLTSLESTEFLNEPAIYKSSLEVDRVDMLDHCNYEHFDATLILLHNEPKVCISSDEFDLKAIEYQTILDN